MLPALWDYSQDSQRRGIEYPLYLIVRMANLMG